MSLQTVVTSIILASGSPRRRELLAAMGLRFEVLASDVDETPRPGEDPLALASRLSLAKAEAVAKGYSEALVIAADTLVVVDHDLLGKPSDAAMAFEMLARLRGREHWVYTGLAVLHLARGRRSQQVARTPVTMRSYTDDEIRRYIDTGDPMDKAGAYAIQYAGFDPVARIAGCYANVMGFPMCHFYRLLRAWGVAVPIHPLQSCPLAVEKGCPWSSNILSEMG